MLADMTIDGKVRKVLMQAPKNGFFYVIDRETGQFISAKPYVSVNWASGIDPKTGRPIENPETRVDKTGKPALVTPGALGGHNWHPMAFNPQTGLVYIPAMQPAGIFPPSTEFQQTGKYTRREMFWNPGVDWNNYVNTVYAILAQTGGNLPLDRGYLKAWDPIAKKTRWEIEYPAFWNGGLLTTAGNLLFQGTGDGRFVAYSADLGKTLWSVPTMVGIVGGGGRGYRCWRPSSGPTWRPALPATPA